jgi:uncharacterized protein YegP (UPF0339 family)
MGRLKFQYYAGTGEQYCLRLHADNGEVILANEDYSREAGWRKGMALVKENSVGEDCFRRKRSTDIQYRFVLVAVNGESIGHSETCSSEAACENGIEVVTRGASCGYRDSIMNPRAAGRISNDSRFEIGSITLV